MITAVKIYHDDDGKWFMKCGSEIEFLPIKEGFELNTEHFISEMAHNMLQNEFNRSFFWIDEKFTDYYKRTFFENPSIKWPEK